MRNAMDAPRHPILFAGAVWGLGILATIALNRGELVAHDAPPRSIGGAPLSGDLGLHADPVAPAAVGSGFADPRQQQGPPPGDRGQPPSSRVIRGEVRLKSVDRVLQKATVTITLYRTMGALYDARGEKIAEMKFFNVSKGSSTAAMYLPFTFGDFYPRPGARYTLQTYIDVNTNDRRDAGDYWNQRLVEVLTPEAPDPVVIDDFAPLLPSP